MPSSGSRNFQNKRPVDSLLEITSPGPYLAKVVSHLDNKFMGSLKVQLLKVNSSNSTTELTEKLITAFYASPFYGVSSWRSVGQNDDFQSTQQSYGMWFVPPDVDTKVLVMFVEGRRDICYWFACVPDDYMNFMIPDGRPSTVLTSPGSRSEDLAGKKLPVGEYNKALYNPQGNNQPTSYVKPVNQDFVDILTEQGLLEDDFRGLTSSSARREVPSAVFGINTPGPLDKRPGAPTAPRGAENEKANVYRSRLGGHSIVMDDGDDKLLRIGSPEDSPPEYVEVETADPSSIPPGAETRPANELFRIRTRTGHQILLHNTEDLIYISNSKGTAWIELTSNGKIDIYANDSVSIHTENDFNVTADGSINLTAGRGVNINATQSIRNSAGENFDLIAAGYISANAGNSLSLQSGEFTAVNAGTSLNLTSAGGSTNMLASESILAKSGAQVSFNAGTEFYAGSTTNINLAAGVMFNAYGTGGNILMDGPLKITGNGRFDISSSSQILINAPTIDVLANGPMYLQSDGEMNITVGADGKLLTAGAMSIKTGGLTKIEPHLEVNGHIYASQNIETASDMKCTTQWSINGVTGRGQGADAADIATPAAEADPADNINGPLEVQPADPVPPIPAALASRVPQHEPWLQHENLDPVAYSKENIGSGEQALDTYVSPLPDTFLQIGRNRLSTSGYASEVSQLDRFRGGRGAGENVEEELGSAQYDDGTPIPTEPYTQEAVQAIEFFKGKGYTDAQACGIVGAIQVESSYTIEPGAYLAPDARTREGRVVGAGGLGARGIVQWRGGKDRLLRVERFLGKPILMQPAMDVFADEYPGLVSERLPTSSIRRGPIAIAPESASREEQLEAVWWELQRGDSIAASKKELLLVDTGNGAADARRVATIFENIFLRANGQGNTARQRNAEVLFRKYTLGETPVSPGADAEVVESVPSGTPAEPLRDTYGGVENVVTNYFASKTRSVEPKEQWLVMMNSAARDTGITEIRLTSAGQEVLRRIPTGYTDYANWFTFPRRDQGNNADLRSVQGGKYWLKKINGEFLRRPNGNYWRTGSERHDTGLAGDIILYTENGVVSSSSQEGRDIMNRFCVAAVKYGARGFGHAPGYMGVYTIHIDMLGEITGTGWDQNRIGYWNGTQSWFYSPLEQELARILRN